MPLIPLELLAAGEIGRIHSVEGDPPVTTRLQELGFVAGAVVEMLQPGTPLRLRLNRQQPFSYRADDHVMVLVDTDAHSADHP
jgi:Fe2+ transport system protein FeoA